MEYILSDTHFDHQNIIDYCDRPFTSTDQMNKQLLSNWNRTVDEGDEVLFLGDLTIAGTPSTFLKWIDRPQGEISFVVGDHDEEVVTGLDDVHIFEHYQLEVGDHDCYCVHNPDDAPSNWDGWILHGHHHNNWPDEYLFVHPTEHHVNVSVELIEYTPMPLPELAAYLDDRTWLDTRPDEPPRGTETA